ncbi:MAG: hypothetical protein U9Q77_06015, partial [Candidatus Marinimicrobia bacterium]|nr:hypothetical protein [Candidatus Neomarinimicrobiota bacterium]
WEVWRFGGLGVGGWGLGVGGWRLGVGGWELGVGGWELGVRGWEVTGSCLPGVALPIAHIVDK